MSESCAGCRFFVQHTRLDEAVHAEVNLKTGDCRRQAPRARLAKDGAVAPGFWPPVRRDDFCGEWRGAS